MKKKRVLPKAIEHLVLDIAEYLDISGCENKMRAQKDPVAWLLSMLERIKERLPEVSAMLYSTVGMASDDEYLEEAREKLSQEEAKANS